jgi:hypothetical protein
MLFFSGIVSLPGRACLEALSYFWISLLKQITQI